MKENQLNQELLTNIQIYMHAYGLRKEHGFGNPGILKCDTCFNCHV